MPQIHENDDAHAGFGTLRTLEDQANKGQPDGYAGLDSSGEVPEIYLPSRVKSVAKAGGPQLTGDVTFSEGANVTLTRSGNDIEIAAAAAGISGVKIDDGGALVGTRPEVNLIAGSNVTLTVADNAGANRVDVTIAASGGGGGLTKLFDSTLSGSAASIDTGAGGIAGTLDSLLIFILARTDEAVGLSTLPVTFNNDSGANYDVQLIRGAAGTASAGRAFAQTSWGVRASGANLAAGTFAQIRMELVAYAQTTAHKIATAQVALPDTADTNSAAEAWYGRYRSTAAISRMKVAAPAGKNLVAGSRLLVYGF